MHWYPSFSERYVLYELPMVRGWAYYSASMESDPWILLGGVKRNSSGYVKQEIERLMAMVKA